MWVMSGVAVAVVGWYIPECLTVVETGVSGPCGLSGGEAGHA